jgi:sortase A
MRRAIAAVGRTLITVGLLILLFVAFQLWGTGLVTARAQDDMRSEFERELASTTTTSSATTTTAAPESTAPPPTTTPSPPPNPGQPPEAGHWIGTIEIPSIGIDKVFVEGTSRDDLKKGPGHYPGTPLPGQLGNAAIAGHRTTYGQPFFDLDKVSPGDQIVTTSPVGRYTYAVRETLVVNPNDTFVVDDTPDAQLTLTTCNPKFSARQRLVVKAALVPEQSSAVFGRAALHEGEAAPEPALAEGLEGESKPLGPAYGWGAIVAVVGLAWWWLFRRWRHPLTWLAGVLPFLIVLFGFYYFLERALPAGY